MSEFLFQYVPVHPITWVYLSSLLMIGLFFKFGRFWSVRNLDLLLLVLLSPGLLLVHFGGAMIKLEQSEAASALAAVDKGTEGPSELSVATAGPTAPTEEARPGVTVATMPRSPDLPAPPLAAVDVKEVTPADDFSVLSESADQSLERIPAFRRSGRAIQYLGFVWLLGACGLFLIRLLLDPTMVRRPLLEPNLSPGGLTFIGCSLFVFLMANVVNSQVAEDDLAGPRGADQLLAGMADQEGGADPRRHGPGNALLHFVPSLATVPLSWRDTPDTGGELRYVRIAKTMAILSHLAIVFGIVAIGYRHFENIRMGVGAATLYLMLPYTSQMSGRVEHVLPAALLVWAVLCYRRPMTAGMFIGLAVGVIYYPLFLLPLWVSFYWQRGLMRFVAGVLISLSIAILSLVFVSADVADFVARAQTLLGIWWPEMDPQRLRGVWHLGWEPVFRIPFLAAFVAISGAMAIWPAQKNLGTLLSCSAAIMVATQFWHGFGGGLYIAWFLPMTLLTIFRPNLEDRVALTVLGEGWFHRRRHRAGLSGVEKAA